MVVQAAPLKVRVVTLKINGKDMSAREDQSILDVAREHGFPSWEEHPPSWFNSTTLRS